jgi:hypothetical protein
MPQAYKPTSEANAGRDIWVSGSRWTKTNDLNFTKFIEEPRKPYLVCIYPILVTVYKSKEKLGFLDDSKEPTHFLV